MTNDALQLDALYADLQRFTLAPQEDFRTKDVPSTIDIINQYNLLPSAIGVPGVSTPQTAEIKTIFDPKFQDYIESLPYKEQDQFFSAYTSQKNIFPEISAKEGNSGGVFGQIKSIAGDGLGIVADGFKLLDVFSQSTEQSLGFGWSFLTQGFGSDLSLKDRWDAGRLFYEGLNKDVSFNYALSLAAAGKDTEFDNYIKKNEGGWIDAGLRFVLDPLWLVGGVPLLPGAIKLTRIKELEGFAEALRVGATASKIPLLGSRLEELKAGRGLIPTLAKFTLFPALDVIGLNTETRLGEKAVSEIQLAGDLSKKLIDDRELQLALGQATRPGFLGSLMKKMPEYRAESAATEVSNLLRRASDRAQSPEELKALIGEWKNADNLPNALFTKGEEELAGYFQILQKIDTEKFKSLSGKFEGDWRVKFQDEVMSGLKRNDPDSGILGIAKEVYGADGSSPLRRVNSLQKWALGFTVLNTPAYAVLNLVNNVFTVGFDALASFDRDPYGTLGVVTSKFGLFTERHDRYMSEVWGANWKDIRDNTANGYDWLKRETGLADTPKHIWDNVGFNFGVRLANKMDTLARQNAAEFAMLNARHFTNRFGQVFPDVPSELESYISKDISPTDLINMRADIEAGSSSALLGMEQVKQKLWESYTDPRARAAAQATLGTHLKGEVDNLDRTVIEHLKNGNTEEAIRAIDQSRAEMQMMQQRAARTSNMGPSSPPVTVKSLADTSVRDWAVMSDEFTYWNSQLNLIAKAADPSRMGNLARGQMSKKLEGEFGDYIEVRKAMLDDFVSKIYQGNSGKNALDELEAVTKIYKERVKAAIDEHVNRLAKIDIVQARVFNDAGKRFIDSIGTPEATFVSSLRKAYWPRNLPESDAIKVVQEAIDTRARQVRGLFGQNVDDFRVGSFASMPVLSEGPMLSDKFNSYWGVWDNYTNHIKSNIDDVFKEAQKIDDAKINDKILEFIDKELIPRVDDYEWASERFVKFMTDFSMLDYTHQLGFERYIQTVFPYEYWPTRTAWHWAQRAVAKPGAASALAHIMEFEQDYKDQVNEKYLGKIREQLDNPDLAPEVRAELEKQLEDGNALPGRMRKLMVPVPFLNDLMGKVGLDTGFIPEIAFDPYAAIFPIANWSREYGDFNAEPTNWFGRIWKSLDNIGVAPSPLMKSVFDLAGVLPERDEAFDFLRRASPPALIPLGAGTAGQAIQRWISLGDDSLIAKLEKTTGLDIRDFYYEHGYGPQGLLQYLAAEITGTDPRDSKSFELYGTSRALASLAAQDPKLLSLEQERKLRKSRGENPQTVDADINDRRQAVSIEYVRAFYDKSGELWDKARKFQATQDGLKDMTSWLFGMGGFNIWTQGEAYQIGLEFLHDAVMTVGDKDQRDEFYSRYPEFTPRTIQDTVLSNPEDAIKTARENLWYWEFNLIDKKYSRREDELTQERDSIDAELNAVNSGDLSKRVNRDYRGQLYDMRDGISSKLSALYDEKNAEIDKLDALYGSPENSTGKNPWERTLRNYADQWYDTFRINDKDARQKAQDEFLAQFPPGGLNQSLAWIGLGAQANALRLKASQDSYGKTNEDRRLIQEKLDSDIEKLTQMASQEVTARDIIEFIGLKEQGPPTPQLAEYKMAQALFTQYKGIELLGLSDDEERRQKREFWDSQPLLEKYYGLESYQGSPEYAIQSTLQQWYQLWENAPEDEAARGEYLRAHSKEIDQLRAILEPAGLIDPQDPNQVRLGDLWDEYYNLPEGKQRQDFLNQHRAEINQLNKALGKETITTSGGIIDAYGTNFYTGGATQASKDAAREAQIWNHYFSLEKGNARRAYLQMVASELNEIRGRLGKDPIVVDMANNNPRMSDSAPLDTADILGALR